MLVRYLKKLEILVFVYLTIGINWLIFEVFTWTDYLQFSSTQPYLLVLCLYATFFLVTHCVSDNFPLKLINIRFSSTLSSFLLSDFLFICLLVSESPLPIAVVSDLFSSISFINRVSHHNTTDGYWQWFTIVFIFFDASSLDQVLQVLFAGPIRCMTYSVLLLSHCSLCK